jgi:hypothetical protein
MTDAYTRSPARRDAARALPPPPARGPGEGRAAVMAAARLLQEELDRLYALQASADRREAARRSGSAEADRITAEASRKAEARQALRAQSVLVPRSWFWSFANEVLDEWRAEASGARSDGRQGRADQIQRRCDSLCTQLEKVQRDELLWTGKP